jgi:two-component system OmpR family sensor kinase
MTSNYKAAPSLKRRLMVFLLAAISLAALVQGITAYRTALQEANEIFDYHMQQMALSLGGVNGGGRGAQDDLELVVQAWTAEGLQVFQSTARAGLPQRAVLGFSNVEAEGRRYRVVSVQTGGQVVQVAQELVVRERLASRLALRTVTPIALMLPILMLVVGWVVSRSLAPVERVRAQLAKRAAEDLSPVGEGGLPAEIKPMVQELNSLLGRVQQSFKAQQHFVADAAHELRSPLTALNLQVQALQRAPDGPARALAQTRLAAGIARASHLVEQLLLLARQEADGSEHQSVALAPLLRQIAAELAPAALARQIDLGLLHADALSTPGNAAALATLLRNLLGNALKYTPEGGRVDVSLLAGEGGQAALIRIDDSGPGIAEAERERVFDRFYRTAEAAEHASGSGLGLAIARVIADKHGASLTLGKAEQLGGLRVELLFRPRP